MIHNVSRPVEWTGGIPTPQGGKSGLGRASNTPIYHAGYFVSLLVLNDTCFSIRVGYGFESWYYGGFLQLFKKYLTNILVICKIGFVGRAQVWDETDELHT